MTEQHELLERIYEVLETRVAVIDTLIDWKSSHMTLEESRVSYLKEHEKFAALEAQLAEALSQRQAAVEEAERLEERYKIEHDYAEVMTAQCTKLATQNRWLLELAPQPPAEAEGA